MQGRSLAGGAGAHRSLDRPPVEPEKNPPDDKRSEHAVKDGECDFTGVDSRHQSSRSARYDASMTEGKTATGTRMRGWLRFVLALWAIAVLLLVLQSVELKLFEVLGG